MVHKSGNLGDSSHLSPLGQITSLRKELHVHTIDERLLQDSLRDQTTGIGGTKRELTNFASSELESIGVNALTNRSTFSPSL